MTALSTIAALLMAQLAPPTPAVPEPPADLPALTIEQTTSLRCSVHFAMVAKGQREGEERALAYPPMEERAKEFFVRAMARVMDEAGLSRDEVRGHVAYEVERMTARGPEGIGEIMPPCLMLLDASGL